MPSYSAIDLAEIRRSSKISSWIWSIISGVVTVVGRPTDPAAHRAFYTVAAGSLLLISQPGLGVVHSPPLHFEPGLNKE
jgi:hypothetical protein